MDLKTLSSNNIPSLENNFGLLHMNSKDIQPNDVFIALPGGERDAHLFVQNAFIQGAAAAIVSQIPANLDQIYHDKLILVPDTFEALRNLAISARKDNSGAKFIALTGSVGKTSTKEALGQTLNKIVPTFYSRANFNNFLGVCLNLASMKSIGNKYCVFEVGMNKTGEITEINKILKPDIAIITNVAPAHLHFFDSIEDIVRAKAEIFNFMNPKGSVILPRDNEYYEMLFDLARVKMSENQIYSFGCSQGATSRVIKHDIDARTIEIAIKNQTFLLKYNNFLGKQAETIISLVLLQSYLLDLDLNKTIESLEKFELLDGRGKQLEICCYGKKFSIIDDCYNASPLSTATSLANFRYLSSHAKNLKIIVLSDMLELGPQSAYYHERLAEDVLQSKCDLLITIGPMMRFLYNTLNTRKDHNLKMHYFNNIQEFEECLDLIIDEGNIILFKGSKGTKLSQVIQHLKNHSSK